MFKLGMVLKSKPLHKITNESEKNSKLLPNGNIDMLVGICQDHLEQEQTKS